MIGWWGPIIHEYYGGTEGNGLTWINSAAWLAHPGSVGKAIIGVVHICDEDGSGPAGGRVRAGVFRARCDADSLTIRIRSAPAPRSTRASGVVDARRHRIPGSEGYLYLTDRKAFMIISGGVNIYPREIEDTLVAHPAVRDVAVFGLPDPEMGEQVKAVVEPMDGFAPSDALAAELIGFARQRMAHFKAPKSLDFTEALPRLPTGKLYKHALRAEYLARRP